jgi:hypothetical protein
MATQRNLAHDTKYKFVSSIYSPILEGGGWCCENCNKPISTIVTVENEGGKQFMVGSDCATTLQGLNKQDIQNIEVITKKAKKFLKALEQNKNYLIGIDPKNQNELFLFAVTTEYFGRKLEKPSIHVPFVSMPKNCLPKRLESKIKTKQVLMSEFDGLEGNYYIDKNYFL